MPPPHLMSNSNATCSHVTILNWVPMVVFSPNFACTHRDLPFHDQAEKIVTLKDESGVRSALSKEEDAAVLAAASIKPTDIRGANLVYDLNCISIFFILSYGKIFNSYLKLAFY